MISYRCLLPALLWTANALAGSAPAYRIETVAGSSLLGDGGPATMAQIGNIEGVAADHLGNVYLSDPDHQRIRKINSAGMISTIAGTGGTGFSGDGGPAALAQLNLPYGLAVDLAGYLYIADLGNNRVRRISPDGIINTYAGGSQSLLGDLGLATAARLFAPRNLAVDNAGSLFISEFEGHRVRKVGSNGIITTVAGTGQAGFWGEGTLATGAQLNLPAGIAVDRTGTLYIADSQNHRVRKVLANGVISTVLGGPQGVDLTPVGLAVDLAGNLFVADQGAVVYRVAPGGALTTVASEGLGLTSKGGPAFSTVDPGRDVAVDFAGNLLIADIVHLHRLDSVGQLQTIAGDAYVHAVSDGQPASLGLLFHPSAVALDSTGNLYIADTGTERVRVVQPSGVIQTFAGTGVMGANGDVGPAGATQLAWPMGVATGLPGMVWIGDTGNFRVRRVSGGTMTTLTVAAANADIPQYIAPHGLCTGLDGALYIPDTANHRVLRVGMDGVGRVVAGNGSPGAAGDGAEAVLAQLVQPSACAVDSLGNLFIADTFNHRIRKVSTAGIITTVAGTGLADSALDGVAATVSPLNTPQGVAVDGNGNLYIADTYNHRIRMVTADGIIHTIAGHGEAGFAGDGGDAAGSYVDTPLGLTVDGAGNIYFADSLNNRVRRLVPLTPPPVKPPAPPPPMAVVNAASLTQGAVAPGESVTIYGNGIGPQAGVAGSLDASGLLGNLLGGSEVRFDGVPAPLFYAQAAQINAQVPYTVAGNSFTHVELFYQGTSMGTLDLPVAAASPALMPVVTNQDGGINSASAPAARGTIVTLYGTGEGLTNGGNIAGLPAAPPYPVPTAAVTLSIGGVSAQLLYAGSAPGFVGLLQLNALVPGGFVAAGPVAVILTVGGVTSPVLTMWLQ